MKNLPQRSYNWTTLLYPESCVSDIISALQDLKVPCALSPLHDQDICNDTGELKKPHFHLVLHYTSLKSQRQVKEDLEPLGAVGAEQIRSLRTYVRYLIHADDTDKAQYNLQELKVFNGFSVDKYFDEEAVGTDAGFAALVKIAIDNGYTDYCDLVTHCLECDAELIPSCRKCAYALTSFLRSRAFQIKEELKANSQS